MQVLGPTLKCRGRRHRFVSIDQDARGFAVSLPKLFQLEQHLLISQAQMTCSDHFLGVKILIEGDNRLESCIATNPHFCGVVWRIIDMFADKLVMLELGFERAHAKSVGRLACVEAVLKLRQIAVQMLDGNPVKTPNPTSEHLIYSAGGGEHAGISHAEGLPKL
jgi:hypothetical protein